MYSNAKKEKERKNKISGVSSYKASIPSLWPIILTSSKPNYLSKAPSPNAIALEVSASTNTFWRNTIQSIELIYLGQNCKIKAYKGIWSEFTLIPV